MQTAILVLHIFICIFLVILVLLQSGREGMGVIFGGGNSSVFGSQGAGGILTKLTAFLAVLFVVTSLSYNIMYSSQFESSKSILDVQFEETTTPSELPANTPPVAPENSAPSAPEPAPTTSKNTTN